MLTFDRAFEVLNYDPDTGDLTWKIQIGSRCRVGARAGHLNAEGYWHVQIDGKKYLGHRLAWLIVTGSWPSTEIDHEDTIKSNNRWSNLRVGTHAENMFNQGLRKSNSTGFKGVSARLNGKYQATIRAHGKTHYLGVFDRPETAHAAYVTAANDLHQEFVRTA